MEQLVTSLVLSRLDYCNVILVGLPALIIAPLQRVQNAAERVILRLHITSELRELHAGCTASSSNSQSSCTKSLLLNGVRRTSPTSSPSARQTHSDDLCARRRLVQPSLDVRALNWNAYARSQSVD